MSVFVPRHAFPPAEVGGLLHVLDLVLNYDCMFNKHGYGLCVSRGQFTVRCTFTMTLPTLNIFITEPTTSYKYQSRTNS